MTGLFLAFALVGQTGAAYDAQAQLLKARGAAVADLRAPTAAIARVRAERQARARAEARLKAALERLGATLDDGDLATLLLSAKGEPEYGSDGSVDLTLTVSTSGLALGKGKK